jgi:UPF0716 protein FxsA
MRLSARLPTLLVLWLVAEIVTFNLIAGAVGFGGALLLCLLTSLVGVVTLRRLGVSTAWRLRRAMATGSQEQAGVSRDAVFDGGLAAFGALLLILPGFVSDFFGLALAAPSVRGWLGAMLQKGPFTGGLDRRRSEPGVIELDPQEWSRTDPPARAKTAKLGPRKQRPQSSAGAEPQAPAS